MHFAASLAYAEPSAKLLIRTGMICAPHATPATPRLLLVAAAAAPATLVPWPWLSFQFAVLSTTFVPRSPLKAGTRSGTLATPVSQMPMRTLVALALSQAPGAWIFVRCHCWEKLGSFG